jgi:hypothetical protein
MKKKQKTVRVMPDIKMCNDVKTLSRSLISSPLFAGRGISGMYVSVDYDYADQLARKIKKVKVPRRPNRHPMVFWRELIASSINYCYWYGSAGIRPQGCGSTKMYEIVDAALASVGENRLFAEAPGVTAMQTICKAIIHGGFPLADQRVRHLREVWGHGGAFLNLHRELSQDPSSAESMACLLNRLVEDLPGFSGDLFRKRAFLMANLMYREHGWFKEGISALPIAADYQIPKMLNHFQVIRYRNSLDREVLSGVLIPEHSRKEVEIRAASVLACQYIAQKAGVTPTDVDAFLWTRRQESDLNFHLTPTTAY